MKFSTVIGNVDANLVSQAETKLTSMMLELATRYNNEHVGSLIGGDPLIFMLMAPCQHVCTLGMPTAATDGKRYYWNPKFVLKQSKIGLRIIAAHEAWHAIYMHPMRRGSRLPKLWNIAVDYIVNGMVMEDFKNRKMNPDDMFQKHLGRYMTLKQYAEMLKDPFKPQKGFEDVDPIKDNTADDKVVLPKPSEDRDLTPEEQKSLENKEKKQKFYFADSTLDEEMKSPEKIYDFLYGLLPKCPKCGSVGMYKKPQPKRAKGKSDAKGKGEKGEKGDKPEKGKGKGDPSDQHDHGGDQPCDCGDKHEGQGEPGDQPGDCCGDQDGDGQGCGEQGDCGSCGDGMDVFGLGGTVDDHLDSEETQEKLAKRLSEAIETTKKMAGHVPGAMEDELGLLTAPKITWQDVIRTRILRARQGGGKNDWTRFRTRPMFSGLLVPKRKSYFASFGCLLDTSGSMSRDDMAYGLSQLQSLDDRNEGTIVPSDCTIYWDDATKVKKCDADMLNKVKIVGRGGTMFADFFNDYEKEIGKQDFLIVITDGYLMDTDVAAMKDPGIQVFWILTANSGFKAPFGRCYNLRD